ncbi:MAG: flavoprotein [Elusimicrobiota bacterium]
MKIILGISGAVAAYKSAFLSRLFVKQGWELKVVMTEAAKKFISPLTFKALSSNPVYSEMFSQLYDPAHISLSKWADLIVVAPATANTLAKTTAGLADNLLSSIILDFSGPVVLCPAMHAGMWNAPATVCNIKVLKERGFIIVGPGYGSLACGDEGKGRMSEPENILKEIKKLKKCKEDES